MYWFVLVKVIGDNQVLSCEFVPIQVHTSSLPPKPITQDSSFVFNAHLFERIHTRVRESYLSCHVFARHSSKIANDIPCLRAKHS